MNAAVPLAPVVPLLGAVLLLMLSPVISRRIADVWSLTVAAATATLCALLLVAAQHEGMLVYWFGGWRPGNGVQLGIDFAVDPVGAGLALANTVLTLAVLAYAWHWFDEAGALFDVLVLVHLAAAIAVSLTGDAFDLFVFFEVASVASFALAGYKIRERLALRDALNFAIAVSLGAFLTLFGITLLEGRTGQLNMVAIGEALQRSPAPHLALVAFALVTTGFLVKASVVPFHFWFVDAQTTAPAPVGVLFSGIAAELGLYAVVRLWWAMFAPALQADVGTIRWTVCSFGALGALVAAALTLRQRDLKRTLAFLTVAHMGLFLVGFGLLQPLAFAGMSLSALGFALVVAVSAMAAGLFERRFGTTDEARLRGFGKCLPFSTGLAIMAGIAIIGVPPFLTASGPALVLAGLHGRTLLAFAALTAVVSGSSGGALLRAWVRIGFAVGEPVDPAPDSDRDWEESSPLGPAARLMTLAPPVVLFALALATSVLPTLVGAALDAAGRFTDPGQYQRAVLHHQHVVLWHLSAAPVDLAVLSGASLLVAAVTLLVGLYPQRLLRGRLPLGGLVARLDDFHAGRIGDYVTWLVLGAAAFTASLVIGASGGAQR